jgi:hypothetical protein
MDKLDTRISRLEELLDQMIDRVEDGDLVADQTGSDQRPTTLWIPTVMGELRGYLTLLYREKRARESANKIGSGSVVSISSFKDQAKRFKEGVDHA